MIEAPNAYTAYPCNIELSFLLLLKLSFFWQHVQVFFSFYGTFKLSHTLCGMLKFSQSRCGMPKFFHSRALKLNIFIQFFLKNNSHLIMAPPLELLLMSFLHFFCVCRSCFIYVSKLKVRP
jgi:hypothetical protein